VDMTPIATVERDAKLEGKNMFMILAPRLVPTGPPKFTQPHHDAASIAAASAAVDAKHNIDPDLASEDHHDDHDDHDHHEEQADAPVAATPAPETPEVPESGESAESPQTASETAAHNGATEGVVSSA
jgi:hypothetical protein